jgi:hypothetical protein
MDHAMQGFGNMSALPNRLYKPQKATPFIHSPSVFLTFCNLQVTLPCGSCNNNKAYFREKK